MTTHPRIAVLTGGPSCEHDVSVAGGKEVLCALGRMGYHAFPVFISRGGTWQVSPQELKDLADIVLIALKGEYGEDGTVQDILRAEQIPFTGSDALSSALGMHKVLSGNVFMAGGLQVPEFAEYRAYEPAENVRFDRITFPIVIKPADRGSSLGVSIVRTPEDVSAALDHASAYTRTVLVQQFVPGREITVGVIERNGVPKALPPIGIVSNTGDLHDHASKYAPRGSEHLVPAPLSAKEDAAVRFAARRMHELIGARGYSRSDMRVTDEGCVYVLEVNTLPDMTPRSSYLRAARAEGMELSDVLEAIIVSELS